MSYQLLYHMMTLLKGRSDKAFEMVVDLTQASLANEPDVSVRESLAPLTNYLYTTLTFLLPPLPPSLRSLPPPSLPPLPPPPQLELLVKFAAYVPELAMSQIEAVYFYSANLAFKQYATKLANSIRIFSHIKVCLSLYIIIMLCVLLLKL